MIFSRLPMLVLASLLGVAPAFAQSGVQQWQEKGWCSYHYPSDKPPPSRVNLPIWVCESSYVSGLQSKYTPYTRMNPFFITGDFDGDGDTDIALWVKNNETHKVGVLILTKAGKQTFVAGAGQNTEERGADYSYIDSWTLLRKGEVLDSGYESEKVPLIGDAIVLVKSEASAFAIYWNGRKFKFYQVSD
jgi:hypothetical protein